VRQENTTFEKSKDVRWDFQEWRMLIVTVGETIDAIASCDECIDETGLIPGMIAGYDNDWFLVHDDASCHS
jgi:hypothetical protein